jgi:hypothetical protein
MIAYPDLFRTICDELTQKVGQPPEGWRYEVSMETSRKGTVVTFTARLVPIT